MAQRIDGKAIAQIVRNEVASGVAEFTQRYGRAPGLHVVLAGDDPASAVYVRNKEKMAKEVGIAGEVHRPESSITQAELMALVAKLNADPSVDGILVQLPLYPHLEAAPVLDLIDPAKDVDGFHPVNVGRLWSGLGGLVPCTPRGW